MPKRIEVWSGVINGETKKTWFVSLCEEGNETIVHDAPTEEEAREAASEWGLPVSIRRFSLNDMEPAAVAALIEAAAFSLFCKKVARALRAASREEARAIMRQAETDAVNEGMWSDDHAEISSAAWADIARQFAVDEYAVHDHIERNLQKYVPGAALSKAKGPKGLCDFLLIVNGEPVPVEVKRSNFTKKSVAQLRRYMDYYNANKGIAMARRLTAELEDGMTFIQIPEKLE